MTLTQTIVAPWGIWQCSDYRLINLQTGEIHEHWSHKFLDVLCNDGRALITYTGLGRLDFDPNSPDLSEWMADQLQGFAINIPETIKRIEDVSTRYLMKYDTSHIFTVGAFIQGQAWLLEVANVEVDDCSSSSRLRSYRVNSASKRLKSFRVYSEHISGQPIVLLRGETKAVSQPDRNRLRNEIKQRPRRAKRFMKLLAHVNKRASDEENYGRFISRECAATYMPANGEGVLGKGFPWGNEAMPWSTVAPPRLFHGINMTKFLRDGVNSLEQEVLKNKASQNN